MKLTNRAEGVEVGVGWGGGGTILETELPLNSLPLYSLHNTLYASKVRLTLFLFSRLVAHCTGTIVASLTKICAGADTGFKIEK